VFGSARWNSPATTSPLAGAIDTMASRTIRNSAPPIVRNTM
jgi:hypothetical protein